MAGRGAQTFKKRQKEQARKEKQQEKFAKKLARKTQGPEEPSDDESLEPLGLGEHGPEEADAPQRGLGSALLPDSHLA